MDFFVYIKFSTFLVSTVAVHRSRAALGMEVYLAQGEPGLEIPFGRSEAKE